MIQNKKVLYILLFILILGAFLVRFIKINHLPAGLYPDEAVNGTDALNANETGDYKLFYESNNGREGLFINLQAFSILFFGNTILALKFWSIIFGTLTVLGVYLLGVELFRSQRAGLAAAFMTAFSYWAINFSRMGFRAIMVPFILSFAFYFLFKGLRTKKYGDFIISGLIYGLGLHTYIAFRVSPLVLIILFISLLITRQHFLQNYWKQTLIFTIAIFITSAPMLLDFFRYHPEHYASRTSEISVLNPQINQGHIFSTIAITFGLSVQKYIIWGDQNMRHNYPPYPLLSPITSAAFLFGFIYTFYGFFHFLWLRFKKNIRDEKFITYTFLLTWFFVLLIPEFLAYEGNPHALRAIGTIPVVMLIASIPFIWIFGKMESFGRFAKIANLSLLIAAFSLIAIWDTTKYFYFFAHNPKQHQAYEANLIEEVKYIQSLPVNTEKIVITQSMQRVPMVFLNNNIPNITYYYPGEINQISPRDKQNMIIVMNDFLSDEIKILQQRFPNLKLEIKMNSFGDTFYVLKN